MVITVNCRTSGLLLPTDRVSVQCDTFSAHGLELSHCDRSGIYSRGSYYRKIAAAEEHERKHSRFTVY